jgi:RNA polymerase sigma factor (sigma-70 family)
MTIKKVRLMIDSKDNNGLLHFSRGQSVTGHTRSHQTNRSGRPYRTKTIDIFCKSGHSGRRVRMRRSRYVLDCRERGLYTGRKFAFIHAEAAMSNELSFQDLMEQVRRGDGDAAAELVRRYEPAIRRVVRLRLTDARLRRTFDSMDICQSVLGSFFVRAALGQYEIASTDQLLKLLAQMARHKVMDQMRRQRAARRDLARLEGDAEACEVADGGASPSRQVAGRELLLEVQRRLSSEEEELANLRAQGREWADIAQERGGSPEALRKRLARGLDRVAQQLD